MYCVSEKALNIHLNIVFWPDQKREKFHFLQFSGWAVSFYKKFEKGDDLSWALWRCSCDWCLELSSSGTRVTTLYVDTNIFIRMKIRDRNEWVYLPLEEAEWMLAKTKIQKISKLSQLTLFPSPQSQQFSQVTSWGRWSRSAVGPWVDLSRDQISRPLFSSSVFFGIMGK